MFPVWLPDTVTSDLDRALHYTLLWGLEGVELRTVGGPNDRVPHVNVEKIKRRLEESEMLPAAVVPGMFEAPLSEPARWMNDLAVFDETVRLCTRIGCPRVVVSAFGRDGEDDLEGAADAIRQAARVAGRAGLTLAVLNEHNRTRATGAALAELLDATDHPAVKAAWDPVAALRAGEDPADGLAALAGRVALVRCSDGTLRGDTWQPAPFGEGAVDWPGQLRRLRSQGFRGPLSLEVNLKPRPREGLHAATSLIRLIREVR